MFTVNLLFLLTALTVYYMSNPISLMLTLIFVSSVVALLSGFWVSKWLFFSIMLIFLGGMMIIFLYICSLSMNLITMFNPHLLWLAVLPFMLYSQIDEFLPPSSFSHTHLKLIYIHSWSMSLLFLISYLLTVLLVTVKISQNYKGALMKKW